ncbi:OmpA family protein [Hyphomicrobium sp. B1]|uniref:OmpA family protein n=1 Tax=Hyphomicrobium sp. B1 TaxID=3075651 RepID=UPI003C2BDFEE
MTRTTTIILILLSTLFACAASAEELAYTCNYQLGSEAEATRRKIGSAIIAINIAAKTARVDFGKGWFKTMTLLVDGTDVKETSPPASGDELGFFYFDLAANSGGFSGGGKNREFFDSCVRTKISDIVAQSNRAAGAPRQSEPIPGQTAAPSTQKAEPNIEPKLAAKPEPNEAAPPSPLSTSPNMPSAPAATDEARVEEKGGKNLAAGTPTPLPERNLGSEPEKNASEPLSAAPSPSLAAAPPPSAQPTTGDEHAASGSAKASEPPSEPRSMESPQSAPEPAPATPPASVPASPPPADAQTAAEYRGNISGTAKAPTAQPEPSAIVESEKNATEPTPATPPPSASIATADAAQTPAASTGTEEKPLLHAQPSPSASTEPAVAIPTPASNPGAEEKPSPPTAPPPSAESTVAAVPAVEPCRETLDSETHGAAITFANASAILSNDSVAELRKIAEIARSCTNVAIEVGGHTDTFGTRLGNRELSQRRADAVVGVLVSEGVPAEKLRAIGYGQDQPIASNATAAGRRLNRRVEFHITPFKTSG